MSVRRVFVEKKKGFDIEANQLFCDLRDYLGITGLLSVRIVNRYDIEGMTDDEYRQSLPVVFFEPPVDIMHEEVLHIGPDECAIALEYLPGQFDQRADSASQCVQMLTTGKKPEVKVAKLIILKGSVSDEELGKVKAYCINPIEVREASFEKPCSLAMETVAPPDVAVVDGFTGMDEKSLECLLKEMAFAMSLEDLCFCRDYFAGTEKRDPTVSELRVIDTYWSDHCRHTTFLSAIDRVDFCEGSLTGLLKETYEKYLQSRSIVYRDAEKDITLMDLATIAAKQMKLEGKLDDLDVSDEVNACSIKVDAVITDRNAMVRKEPWLVMFKNETHNHPTEIEPFGGAATCLGGAIRDPLSGRSYVYHAMRVTGSGDPRTKIEQTLPGKLPQRKITTGAAAGYSSYGNQIGLATGQVAEVYDEGFVSKRMEIGAVVGAAPSGNVRREAPVPGDVVILLGGRTGRDGCGGATGSSKEHDEDSLATCGAEVQKGNPPTERKIQRLFRNPAASRLIKKCNDFGAGGVSVAIGELADGLDIDLDTVPKKYEGLDGTELAISESQERMAVLVSVADADRFMALAAEENLEATPVAVVTDTGRLRMKWRGRNIIDISRKFLNTNGVKQHINIKVSSPGMDRSYFAALGDCDCYNENDNVSGRGTDIWDKWFKTLQDLNVCSQRGLVERFDGSIGAGSVLMPFGGTHQLTPQEGMAARLPVLDGETRTATLMTYGYDPHIGKWSPFHGAVYAIAEAVAKIAAMGGDYRKTRMSLQEYFEKLGNDPLKWGKPLSALLGAFHAQSALGIPAIGGKDSMSGTFKDLSVPPTVVAFALAYTDTDNIISAEFKKPGSAVILLPVTRDGYDMPDFEAMHKNFSRVAGLASQKKILAASTVRIGGVAAAITKMCFGNMTGFEFTGDADITGLFSPDYGSLILEMDSQDADDALKGLNSVVLGYTTDRSGISVNGSAVRLDKLLKLWQSPLETVFPTKPNIADNDKNQCDSTNDAAWDIDTAKLYKKSDRIPSCRINTAKPRILVTVFPGTNCEYDTAGAFEAAGGTVDIAVIRNLSQQDIGYTLDELARKIAQSQIIVIPGGFSAGDEPDGSGKFIVAAFRNPRVSEAVMDLLKARDGLMLGICNGFQALIKLGLVPYGEIREMRPDSPTLAVNLIGRHMSRMIRTRVISSISPWLALTKPGDMHVLPVSHGEGRFVASDVEIRDLQARGQIATRYVDYTGKPSDDVAFNPNGSYCAIEGITSPDGRILGKMAHSERYRPGLFDNIPGDKEQPLFKAGVEYYK